MTTREAPRVYFDSCCFIDLIKHGRGLSLASDAAEDRKRKDDCWFLGRLCDASRDGAIRIVTSMLTISECVHLGDGPAIDQETKDTIDAYLMSGSVVDLIEADIFVAEKARSLSWDNLIRLKGADLIHLATSLERGCREFITTDHKIHRRGSRFTKNLPELKKAGFRIVRASDTRQLPDEFRMEDMFAPGTTRTSTDGEDGEQ